ncbi:unnamed protein product [Caenorhabditis sp. 36 PRJEB53466]|nr:unnamed protein product [Caenorhabditis sp. 36 PRJEB53466]
MVNHAIRDLLNGPAYEGRKELFVCKVPDRNKRNHPCDFIGSLSAVLAHLAQHVPVLRWKCGVCDHKVADRVELIPHRQGRFRCFSTEKSDVPNEKYNRNDEVDFWKMKNVFIRVASEVEKEVHLHTKKMKPTARKVSGTPGYGDSDDDGDENRQIVKIPPPKPAEIPSAPASKPHLFSQKALEAIGTLRPPPRPEPRLPPSTPAKPERSRARTPRSRAKDTPTGTFSLKVDTPAIVGQRRPSTVSYLSRGRSPIRPAEEEEYEEINQLKDQFAIQSRPTVKVPNRMNRGAALLEQPIGPSHTHPKRRTKAEIMEISRKALKKCGRTDAEIEEFFKMKGYTEEAAAPEVPNIRILPEHEKQPVESIPLPEKSPIEEERRARRRSVSRKRSRSPSVKRRRSCSKTSRKRSPNPSLIEEYQRTLPFNYNSSFSRDRGCGTNNFNGPSTSSGSAQPGSSGPNRYERRQETPKKKAERRY